MIQGFCRVGCQPCGRWLLIMEGGMDTTAAYPDLATAFPSIPAAEKAIANAGWLNQVCRRCQRDRTARAARAARAKEAQPA
jgi:hypothetical protein